MPAVVIYQPDAFCNIQLTVSEELLYYTRSGVWMEAYIIGLLLWEACKPILVLILYHYQFTIDQIRFRSIYYRPFGLWF